MRPNPSLRMSPGMPTQLQLQVPVGIRASLAYSPAIISETRGSALEGDFGSSTSEFDLVKSHGG